MGPWGRLTGKVTLLAPLHPPRLQPPPERCLPDPSQFMLPTGHLPCDSSCPTQAQLPYLVHCRKHIPAKGTNIHTQLLKSETSKPATSPHPLAPSPHLTLGAGGAPSTGADVTGSAPLQLGQNTPAWGGGKLLLMWTQRQSNHLCRHCPPPLVASTSEPTVGP